MIFKNLFKNSKGTLFAILLIFLLDRISKEYIIFLDNENYNPDLYISSFLNIVLIWNDGIAFGLLSFEDKTFYNMITILIAIIIIILLFGTHLFQFIYPNLNRISFTNNRIKPIYNNLVLFSFYLGLSFLFFSIFFGDFYLSLFGNEYLYALSAFKILSFTIFPALVFNLWIHKQYILSKYSTIIFFQLGTILTNILLNYYLINIMGISGAALASLVAPIMSFLIINIPNNHEFRTIVESFSLKKQKEAANAVLKIIFVKKNPDKFENIKD